MTKQAVARLWLHDLMCMSEGCEGEDHAKRTQSAFARDAVRAWKAGEALGPVIHQRVCLGCAVPDAHAFRLNGLGQQLVERWEVGAQHPRD